MGNAERLAKGNSLNSGSEGPKNGHLPAAKEQLFDPRRERVGWWRNAPEDVEDYPEGTAPDGSYSYPAGKILLIGNKEKGEALQVMSTCETPWAFATVDKAFAEFPQDSGPLKVLERGFGMGLTARRAMQHLITRGGEYTVIELNKGNADYAREWIRKFKSGLTNMAGGLPGTKPDINITLIEGDAYGETARLADEGEMFDIIISDTFPLTPDEEGINDLADLDTLKKLLNPKGVFTFFAYYPGSNCGIKELQMSMVRKHFSGYREDSVEINPPPSYTYLQTANGPIRKLPVAICTKPII